MLDLLIRDANLPDGRTGISIGIKDGRIVDVAESLEAEAGETIDAAGCLVTPPFVDSHFHMDATPQPRPAADERERHPAGRYRAVG